MGKEIESRLDLMLREQTTTASNTVMITQLFTSYRGAIMNIVGATTSGLV